LPAAIRRQAPALLGYRHLDFALAHFERREFATARGELVRAILHHPRLLLDRRVGSRLLLSLLGASVAGRLVAWRRLGRTRPA
jgi:hypothetical protein